MPTLQFKGKNAIWNHHLSIPYHTLEEDKKLNFQPEKGEGNLIIEGDNLLALKALLPQHAGRIKCIYIDPPYNTGNEHWVYNDNVNSPLIKEWLGKEVGKDDLTRHDKWLCMMVPRLKLLRELLSDDGVIFVSIDDNEQHRLRLLIDEIFGEENILENIIWKKSYGGGSKSKHVVNLHEYILVASKNIDALTQFELPPNPDILKYYKFTDSKESIRGPYRLQPLATNSMDERPNLRYPIEYGDEEIWPEKQWQWSSDRVASAIENDELIFKKGKSNEWVVSYKQYLKDESGSERSSKPYSIIDGIYTQKGTAIINDLFGDGKAFSFPKPIEVLKQLISFSSSIDSIILDSFAGSGTTMHAVMDLNKEDGGNRKCIMVQMDEATEAEPKKNICKDITRERVKRAIEKNGYNSGFQYLKVGDPIDPESILSGNLPPFKDFAKYVFYLCTGKHHPDEKKIKEKDFFVGNEGSLAIYLIYKANLDELSKLALNLSVAEKMREKHPEERLVVYAPACFLDEEYLHDSRIEFVSIPYGLHTKSGN